MVHLNPMLTLWTLGQTWLVNISLTASIIFIGSRWSQHLVAPPLGTVIIKVAAPKHTKCRVYVTHNLWFHFMINKTATTNCIFEEYVRLRRFFGGLALKYSDMVIKMECVTCILLSQITSPHPSILFLSDVKMILKHCRTKRRHFHRGRSSWCGRNDRGLTAAHMCGLQSSPSEPKQNKTKT